MVLSQGDEKNAIKTVDMAAERRVRGKCPGPGNFELKESVQLDLISLTFLFFFCQF